MTNATATGTTLIMDPREPPHNAAAPHIHLQYPPAAVCVQTDMNVPQLHVDLPPNTIPIDHVTSSPFTITSETVTVKVTRTGIPLLPAYAVTDYYMEGATVSPSQHYLIHPDPPPDSHWSIASLYVMMTRYRTWSSVTLLRSLWTSPEERHSLIHNIHRKIHGNANLLEQQAELQRLQTLAESTITRHHDLYTQAQQSTA